jgi:hypothetical protein
MRSISDESGCKGDPELFSLLTYAHQPGCSLVQRRPAAVRKTPQENGLRRRRKSLRFLVHKNSVGKKTSFCVHKAAVRREFDVVMAWSVDRLCRSLQDLIGFLSEVHAAGFDLFLHQQGLDATARLCWLAALLALLSTSIPHAHAQVADEQALRLVNHYRQLAGLTPVKLDRNLSAGCMEHANYMVQNQGTDAMSGLNPHTQRPNLPGASPAGAACAKAADLFLGVPDLGVAIDLWMAGMYHRRPMLDPQLERIGVGYARLPDGMLVAALRFESATRKGGRWPVAYPADKQADVPLDYGTETPNPIPDRGGGYPVTLQFPPFDKVTGVSAKITDATGSPVAFFLSDPEHPATSFGQFGVISLIPKEPLQAQKSYSVRIDATWKGKSGSWTWSFSTVSLRGIEAADDRAVTDAINVASLVHGTVAYGGMRNGETVVLRLVAGESSRYKALSVIIPIAVWRQIAGNAEPGSLKGKVIEVQTTPQVVGGKYINMRISTAAQLRIEAVR